jgi:AraC-like DNA-binding protein
MLLGYSIFRHRPNSRPPALYLAVAFRQLTGQTPSAYREQFQKK